MSAAAATADAPAPKGKKKLLIIGGAVLLLVIAALVLVLLLKKKPAAEDEAANGHEPVAAAKARDPKAPVVFAPLDPFTVNLADKEAERYAQVGITLELVDSATEASLKVFMPAVRNNILMLLAHKTSAELLDREGKERLAREVMREAARGLGIEVEDEEADEDEAPSKKKRKRRAAPELPITAVYFSTFIIQ